MANPARIRPATLDDACGNQGIAYTPFFAIATSDPEPAAITETAAAHAATAAQVRLAWTLLRGPHVLAIPGTGNPSIWPRTSRPPLSVSPMTKWHS